jgi:flagellar biosynthetic protein FliO
LFLFAALAVSGGFAAYAAQTGALATPANSSSPADTFLLNDPNLSNQRGAVPGNRELLFRMMLATALVIVLAVAALYLSRRVLPKMARGAAKEIRVLETTYLGPRKALHLIQVGPHRFLIGSTNENISSLAQLAADKQQAIDNRQP